MRVVNRHLRVALAALGASVLARLLWILVTPNGMNLVDLRVYTYGARTLATGHLYDFTYADKTPDFPLPFTYPPFAALVFYPLHFVPFAVVAIAWLLLNAAALYAVVRIALRLVLGPAVAEARWQVRAVGWTAVGLWLEPVRTTLDYGQVNVFLVLAAMAAAVSSRWWLSGLLVGLAAGVKLTPGVTGLYFLTQRRWLTAVWSAVVFAGSVGVSVLLAPQQTSRYFGPLLGDAHRVGPIATSLNQSLRGALSRLAGHDVGAPEYLAGHRIPIGLWWLVAIAVTVVLAVLAWRALAADDRLGALLVVQTMGLLVSPISWSHHWVWLIPMLLWLRYGPARETRGARVFFWYWLVATAIGVPWALTFLQPTIWVISRPGALSALGLAYVIAVPAFYLWLICRSRLRRQSVDLVRQRHVVAGEPASRVRGQRECDVAPTDVDIGVVVGGLCGIRDSTHQVDAGGERSGGHGAGDGLAGAGPVRQLAQRVAKFVVGE